MCKKLVCLCATLVLVLALAGMSSAAPWGETLYGGYVHTNAAGTAVYADTGIFVLNPNDQLIKAYMTVWNSSGAKIWAGYLRQGTNPYNRSAYIKKYRWGWTTIGDAIWNPADPIIVDPASKFTFKIQFFLGPATPKAPVVQIKEVIYDKTSNPSGADPLDIFHSDYIEHWSETALTVPWVWLQSVQSIAAGSFYTVAVKTDGTLWAWGYNWYGQLGDGTTGGNKNTPTHVGTDTDWATVAPGFGHTVALKTDGTLWAWGDNWSGQLGDGTNVNKNTPTHVGTDTDWATVAPGADHTVAVKTDGTLWAWGGNWSGQLGDGTNVDKNTPTHVGTDTDWATVAPGSWHTVALKTDGTLWAWGDNYDGQLGDGTNVDKNTPTHIGTDTDWATVAPGGHHTVALKTDGTLWAWGDNYDGQLGDGTNVDKNTPTHIGTDTDWAAVAAGYCHTVALKTDGTLWAWGDNYDGQLGDGTNVDKNTPTHIGTDTDWAAVAAGYCHTVALKTDGTLWAWGLNGLGQLGDGTTVSKNTPTRI